jgi:phosphoglycolate phosphatase-like HAD superfamily hydrolase
MSQSSSRFRLRLIRKVARAAPVRSPFWEFPLNAKAILFDLDGTLMPTYQSLAALRYVEDQLKLPVGEIGSFMVRSGARNGFESMLHNAVGVRDAAVEYARKHKVTIGIAILRVMSNLLEQSFCAYEGLRDLLAQIRGAGTFIGVYTNTSCEHAIGRLARALLPPDSFDAIWARSNQWTDGSSLLRDHASVLIPCNYRKPDDTPLREVAAVTGARPGEILFIGDSVSDLEVVYRERTSPGAIFCLQEKGAADVSDRLAALNARLRPGCVPLGLRAINRRIDRFGVDGEVIRLRSGFLELLYLIQTGCIALRAPNQTPIVRDNRLLGRGSSSMHRLCPARTFRRLQASTAEAR